MVFHLGRKCRLKRFEGCNEVEWYLNILAVAVWSMDYIDCVLRQCEVWMQPMGVKLVCMLGRSLVCVIHWTGFTTQHFISLPECDASKQGASLEIVIETYWISSAFWGGRGNGVCHWCDWTRTNCCRFTLRNLKLSTTSTSAPLAELCTSSCFCKSMTSSFIFEGGAFKVHNLFVGSVRCQIIIANEFHADCSSLFFPWSY